MPVNVKIIPPGNAGIRVTAQRMIALMKADSALAEGVAAGVLNSLPLKPLAYRNQWLKAAAVYQWVQRRMVYTKDGDAPDAHPLERGEEGLRDPDYLLGEIGNWGVARGDCDDYVILMGALLWHLGVSFAVVLTSGRPDGEYDHVFLLATDIGVYLDAIHGDPFGWHVPFERVTAIEVIPVR